MVRLLVMDLAFYRTESITMPTCINTPIIMTTVSPMLDMSLVPQAELKQCRSTSTSSERSSTFPETERTQPESSPSSVASTCLSLPPPSPPRPRRRRRNVSFGEVTVREYETTLAIHPCCGEGPPIGLDWTYNENTAIDVDTYEADRATSNGRRTLSQMHLSHAKRRNLLIRQGHTEDELRSIMKEVKKIQMQRKRTHAFLPALPVSSRKFENAAKRIYKKIDKATLRFDNAARKVVDVIDCENYLLEF